jgi:hypothetical protein
MEALLETLGNVWKVTYLLVFKEEGLGIKRREGLFGREAEGGRNKKFNMGDKEQEI